MTDGVRVIPRRLAAPIVYGFIRQRMQEDQTLGKWLLRSLDLDSGVTWTYIPSDMTQESVTNFDRSWTIGSQWSFSEGKGEPQEDEVGAVITVVQDFLVGGENRYFILNDALTRPCQVDVRTPYFLHDDEVYVYASAGAVVADDEYIDWLFSMVPGRAPWGIASSLPVGHRQIERGMQVTDDELRLLSERTEIMLFDAYDSDTLIVWAKSPWVIGIEPYHRPHESTRLQSSVDFQQSG